MWSKRKSVDYGLQRRRTLTELQGALRTMVSHDALDADPLLIRAALHHGTLTERRCPVADCGRLLTLNYTFGDQLGQYSGRIKSEAELTEMENEFGEFTVYVVEVCTECGWNHVVESYVLGDGTARKPPRRIATVEDIYG
ncbi:MAG: DUF5318 domain-containing protein [Propionibacteriaceae bacterium]|jgi:hypothetical protein|nr:DUF5318 domain-containing protein [Propionibacteriaceae bacterium]